MNLPNLQPEKPRIIYIFSAVALLILAYFSVGYYHPDEHFQILEFANWRLGHTSPYNLPWEFHYRMRPAIQPALVVVIHKVFGVFGCTNPFTIAFCLRVLSAALSFTAMWMIYRCYFREISKGILQKWFLLLSFLLWFALYNHVRFSSETWSGSLFVIGFSFLFIKNRPLRLPDYFITGILLGLSFVFRFQAGFLIAGFFLWHLFVKKEKISRMGFLALGILTMFFLGICIDRWFYGEWTLTVWNYFQQNLLADKISGFGVKPWWFYFEEVFIRAIPPFSLVFIGAFLIVFIFLRKNVLTWTLLPFVLFHFLIGHKEIRFLFPLIGFIPIMIIKAIEFLRDNRSVDIMQNKYFLGFARIFWSVNIVFLFIVFFIPADSQINLFKKIYDQYPAGTTLYFAEENPYHRALDIHYYKRDNLLIRKMEFIDRSEAVPERKFLVAIRSKDPGAGFYVNSKLVYSSYPEWIKHFNFNHWMDRTNFWYVYEVEN